MSIEESVFNHLGDQAAIVALVSARIYQTERVQGSALPSIVFSEVGGGESEQDMSSGSVGLAVGLYQFDCYAATSKEAAAIRELVRLAFQNHINATMGSGVHVWMCDFSGQSGGFDPDTRDFVRSIDFEIHYKQDTS